MLEQGGREEKRVLIHERLHDGRVGGCGTTPELLPHGKVMRVSSGSRSKRCIITLRRVGEGILAWILA
jgi:hypothetical protein